MLHGAPEVDTALEHHILDVPQRQQKAAAGHHDEADPSGEASAPPPYCALPTRAFFLTEGFGRTIKNKEEWA